MKPTNFRRWRSIGSRLENNRAHTHSCSLLFSRVTEIHKKAGQSIIVYAEMGIPLAPAVALMADGGLNPTGTEVTNDPAANTVKRLLSFAAGSFGFTTCKKP
jgi:hypothetical protein